MAEVMKLMKMPAPGGSGMCIATLLPSTRIGCRSLAAGMLRFWVQSSDLETSVSTVLSRSAERFVTRPSGYASSGCTDVHLEVHG